MYHIFSSFSLYLTLYFYPFFTSYFLFSFSFYTTLSFFHSALHKQNISSSPCTPMCNQISPSSRVSVPTCPRGVCVCKRIPPPWVCHQDPPTAVHALRATSTHSGGWRWGGGGRGGGDDFLIFLCMKKRGGERKRGWMWGEFYVKGRKGREKGMGEER